MAVSVIPTLDLERAIAEQGYDVIVGFDEVGRGSLAGPVMVGAAAIWARDLGGFSGVRGGESAGRGSYRDIIELIICRSDFVSSMTDEIFFSAMFKAYSPEVAVNYVNSVDIFKKHAEKAEEEIRKGYREYISGDDTFRIDFKVLDGRKSCAKKTPEYLP